MNLLKTDRTYATADNAIKALVIAANKLGKDISDLRYIIGVAENGRFAPVVVGVNGVEGRTNNELAFLGVSWVA